MLRTVDIKMKQFEKSTILPDTPFVVVRLDGNGFSKLTEANFNKPYDETFLFYMKEIVSHIMNRFDVLFAYSQSDEISLLLKQPLPYSYKEQKILTLLAGLASAVFSQKISPNIAIFDARALCLPDRDTTVEYFNSRASDAYRNALNNACYWIARKEMSARKATSLFEKQHEDFKKNWLKEKGIIFDDLPYGQRFGFVGSIKNYPHVGYNPVKKISVPTTRNMVVLEDFRDGYEEINRETTDRNKSLELYFSKYLGA